MSLGKLLAIKRKTHLIHWKAKKIIDSYKFRWVVSNHMYSHISHIYKDLFFHNSELETENAITLPLTEFL